MANKWIEYVKAYSLKHNMKYNDCLKDVNCKAEYQKVKVVKGKGYKEVIDVVKSQAKPVIKSLLKKGVESSGEYLSSKIDGMGKKKRVIKGKGLFSDIGGALGGLGSTFLTANPIAGMVGSAVGNKLGQELDNVIGSGKKVNSVAYISGGSMYPG